MFRTVTVARCASKLVRTRSTTPNERFRLVDQLRRLQLNNDINLRTISLSVNKCADTKKPPRRAKVVNEKESSQVSKEVEEAAVKAAKSVPGNWTKTADELLSRLQSMSNRESPESSQSASPPDADSMSLLSSMKVGRDFEAPPRSKRGSARSNLKKKGPTDNMTDILPRSIVREHDNLGERQPRQKQSLYSNLNGVPRLGIFPVKKVGEVIKAEESQKDDLWAVVEKEHLRKIQGGLPRNAFEEMIRLTEEGKVWNFPIDNEADLHEERKYKFHDHIFLERHLSGFPATGPVRKFMELVCLGLSQNPWLTVPEKLEHITWFEKYFHEKQDVLEASLGEEGKMRESGKLGEGK